MLISNSYEQKFCHESTNFGTILFSNFRKSWLFIGICNFQKSVNELPIYNGVISRSDHEIIKGATNEFGLSF